MHRALFKILVILGLGLGLTFTSMPQSFAGSPTADRATSAVPAQNAPDCSAREAALAKARDNYGKRVSTAKKVRNILAKAERAEKRAKSKKVKKARHARVVEVRQRLKEERARVRVAKAQWDINKEKVIACRNSGPTGPTASPIQTLCDAGIPQEICDTLAALVPGGSTASPLALLCSNAPQAQALCDLISTGTAPDPQDLLDVVDQVLGALGLGDLLTELLDGLGIGDIFDPSDLLDLLDLLGGLLP